MINSEPLVIAATFVTATVYALLLSTREGRRFTVDHTWATVVGGVAIVLMWGSLIDNTAIDWWWRFAAGGVPMVVRSLLIQRRDRE